MKTIYLVHHTHTDIGYTHEQPVVVDLHCQFIDQAIEACERSAGDPAGSQLKWTCETTYPLLQWLRNRPARQIERFQRLEKAGRIEVTGMFTVSCQAMSSEGLYRQLYLVERLRRDYGFTIDTAMQSDINGQHWGLVETLLDSGIKGFSMAINEHFGHAPLTRPNGFYWQGATGQSILTWNGLHYNANQYFEIPYTIDGTVKKLPELEAWLKARNYPYDFMMFQVTRRDFPDNGGINPLLVPFVRQWNAEGRSPRLEIVTLREFMNVLRQQPAAKLPTHRGEWTDYWNFGGGSTAYEGGLNRGNYRRLYEAELLRAFDPAPDRKNTLAEAWENALLFDEHTWGGDASIADPYDEHVVSGLHFKKHYAYTARSQTRLLRQDALNQLARQLHSDSPGPHVLAFNPLPWERACRLTIPSAWLTKDASETSSHIYRLEQKAVYYEHPTVGAPIGLPEAFDGQKLITTRPVTLPAAGYRLLSLAELAELAVPPPGGAGVLENHWLEIEPDARRGGLASLFDKQRHCELVDSACDYPFGGFVYEQMPAGHERSSMFKPDWAAFDGLKDGWNSRWPAVRQGISRVVKQTIGRTADGTCLVQECEAPGTHGVRLEFFLPDDQPWLDLTVTVDKTWQPRPEACYLAFPFRIAGAKAHYETATAAARYDADQLPEANRDFLSVQNWVDLSNQEHGATVVTLDAPLAMFGGFNFGQQKRQAGGRDGLFISWLMNNYWDTNYASAQLGRIQFRYRILPHGKFAAAASARSAQETAFPFATYPVSNPAGRLPASGSFLQITPATVLPLAIKRAEDGDGLIVRLWNPENQPCQVRISSAARPIRQAELCNPLEQTISGLPVTAATVTLDIAAAAVATIRVKSEE